ncbi:hypothetical protein D3C72_1683470 [compost metagenome]
MVEELEHRFRPARQIEQADDPQQVDQLQGDDADGRADQAVSQTAREGQDGGDQQGADLDRITAGQNLNRAMPVGKAQDVALGQDPAVERRQHQGADVDQQLGEGLDEQPLGPGRRQDAEEGDGQQGEQAQILDGGRFEEARHGLAKRPLSGPPGGASVWKLCR